MVETRANACGRGRDGAMIGAFFATLARTLWKTLTAGIGPVRFHLRTLRGRRVLARSKIKRFVVLGIDGMDAALTRRFLAEDKLPHLARLQRQGCFTELGSTIPPISPVAWSSLQTGSNPGKHNIFDFVTRDKKTYLPRLSSVDVRHPQRGNGSGGYPPTGRAHVRLLRKSRPFWAVLGRHGIFSSVIRVPITFPPEELHGVQLSGMCVPDLRGTQGAFSFYTMEGPDQRTCVTGERFFVERNATTVEAELTVPASPFDRDGHPLKCGFTVTVLDANTAELRVNGKAHALTVGAYSPWISLEFQSGRRSRVHGIARFILLRSAPEFQLYVTPIHIDPHRPVVPISYPPAYSKHVAKHQGLFATLGQSEDTWALNEGILTDDDFLQQCLDTMAERERMFLDSLDRVKQGLSICVFDGLDRVQHTFWRDIDEGHPARGQRERERTENVIEAWYRRMDSLVGRTLEKCSDKDTVLMVISDHGFTSFRYGVDLNRWLEENGYLKLRRRGRNRKGLIGVEWSQTRAFALGLAGIFLNLKGREARGIVDPAGEAERLRREIAAKLAELTHPEGARQRVVKRVYLSSEVYRGPYKDEAPDLIVGFEKGYRAAWATAMGQITDRIFHENAKAWSGDHCVDRSLVPGVLFCNRRIETTNPSLLDIGPTVLSMFGLAVPEYMDGRPLAVSP